MEKEKKETAEQKLLKIIENPRDSAPPASNADQDTAEKVAAAVKGPAISSLALPPFLNPILDLFKGKIPAGFSLGLKEINIFLGVGSAIVMIFFIGNVLSGIELLKNKDSFTVTFEAKNGKEIVTFAPTLKQISEYLDNINKRNIFQPFEKKAVEKATALPAEANNIAAMAKDLKLVGISWLDSPASASAMIEDTQTGITYFLKPGETIKEMTIKTIYADRVILSYQGEEAIIKL